MPRNADRNGMSEQNDRHGRINLEALGIDRTQAAELRARLISFAEDWERPEIDVYDCYDAAKALLDKAR